MPGSDTVSELIWSGIMADSKKKNNGKKASSTRRTVEIKLCIPVICKLRRGGEPSINASEKREFDIRWEIKP